jgi:imidazoleglycerol phosphate dehydratase HisB
MTVSYKKVRQTRLLSIPVGEICHADFSQRPHTGFRVFFDNPDFLSFNSRILNQLIQTLIYFSDMTVLN